MGNISLTIDGRQVEVEEGATVLQAARKADIVIPTYLRPQGPQSLRGLPDVHRRNRRRCAASPPPAPPRPLRGCRSSPNRRG